VWYSIVCTALATRNATESNCIIQQGMHDCTSVQYIFNCGSSFRGQKHRTIAFPKCRPLPNSTADSTVSNYIVKMCHECLLPYPSQFTLHCLFCHCTTTWQDRLAACLGKLVNSCFNFKLSKHIGVSGQYIHSVIDCDEWKAEKGHECTNIGKLR